MNQIAVLYPIIIDGDYLGAMYLLASAAAPESLAAVSLGLCSILGQGPEQNCASRNQ